MNSINKLLEYHELLMTYNDTSQFKKYDLPAGYHFEFYEEIYQSNFEYCIWHTKGRYSVEVLYNGMLYKYTYTIENNEAILNFTKDKNKNE